MKKKIINVVDEFATHPKGRFYPEDGDTSGERFRKEILLPELRKAIDESYILIVDLTGYNRYGPSFLDGAFGALVSVDDISSTMLSKYLVIQHKYLATIPLCAQAKIDYHRANKDEMIQKYQNRCK